MVMHLLFNHCSIQSQVYLIKHVFSSTMIINMIQSCLFERLFILMALVIGLL